MRQCFRDTRPCISPLGSPPILDVFGLPRGLTHRLIAASGAPPPNPIGDKKRLIRPVSFSFPCLPAYGRNPRPKARLSEGYLDRWLPDRHCPDMSTSTPKTISPAQAAKRARVGRTTIMRALSCGDLHGVRDNKNAWRISIDDLEAWLGQRPDTDHEGLLVTSGQPMVTLLDTPETISRLAVAEARLTDALNRIEDLKRERDEWREQARSTTDKPGILTRLLRGIRQ